MTKGTSENHLKTKRIETINFYKEVLQKAEVKRVAEKVTKKELSQILELSYTFYMNCMGKTNRPSERMVEALQEYLKMPTSEVYELVFKNRKADKKFHEGLDMEREFVANYFDELKEQGTFNLTGSESDKIIESVQE